MGNCRRNIAFYNANAKALANHSALIQPPAKMVAQFLDAMSPSGRILDFGSGFGDMAHAFLDRGYEVVAIDGSSAMGKIAAQRHGITTKCMLFDEFAEVRCFDGVWAHASLIHVERADLPGMCAKIARALKSHGVFAASFYWGKGSTSYMGRTFTDMTKSALSQLVHQHFCSVRAEIEECADGLRWIWIIACLRRLITDCSDR